MTSTIGACFVCKHDVIEGESWLLVGVEFAHSLCYARFLGKKSKQIVEMELFR